MPDFAAYDPSNLLLGQWNGKFAEAGDEAGIACNAKGRGALIADFNLDGRLDILQINRGSNVLLWRNLGAKNGDGPPLPMGNWSEIKLIEPNPNRNAVGARISIRTGTRTQTRFVDVGGGDASGHSGFIHVGLGAAELLLCAFVIAVALALLGQPAAGALGIGLALALSSTALVLPITGVQGAVGTPVFAITSGELGPSTGEAPSSGCHCTGARNPSGSSPRTSGNSFVRLLPGLPAAGLFSLPGRSIGAGSCLAHQRRSGASARRRSLHVDRVRGRGDCRFATLAAPGRHRRKVLVAPPNAGYRLDVRAAGNCQPVA